MSAGFGMRKNRRAQTAATVPLPASDDEDVAATVPPVLALTPIFGVCYKGLLNENASASPPEDFMSAHPT